MFTLSTPLIDAPWYVLATGPLTVQSLPYVEASIQAARYGEVSPPVLDLSMLEGIDPDAAVRLASMVQSGEVSLLAPDLASIQALPALLSAIVRESHLEAVEAVLALVRQRRYEGLSDGEVLAALLKRIRPSSQI